MTGRTTRPVPLASDDAAVIEASFSEPERFASLFDRHAPHIHRYLACRVGRQAADDLVAETFLAAFGKRGAYDPGFRDARPWLYGIATNLVGRHRREEVRQFRLSQAAGPDPVQSDYAERTVVNLTAQSIRAVLADALSGLAEPDRDVLRPPQDRHHQHPRPAALSRFSWIAATRDRPAGSSDPGDPRASTRIVRPYGAFLV
jgi:RNA polymerase sigma factor (sigma-70 family)